MDILDNRLTVVEPYELLDSGTIMSLTHTRMFEYIIGETFVKKKLNGEEFHSLSISSYAEYFGMSTHGAYLTLLEAMEKGNIPIIDLPESTFTEGAKASKRRQFLMYNSLIYDNSSSTIAVRLAPELIELYNRLGVEGRGYAKYILENTRYMKSILSIRLFKLMNKWFKVGYVKYTLEEFKRLMGFKDGEYSRWNDLHSKVITPAIGDIHKHTWLKVKMLPVKEGRKTIGVQFYIGGKDRKNKVLVCVE